MSPAPSTWMAPPTWMAKAALQQVFSRVPHGEELNYLFQRKVTRSLPPSTADVDLHVEWAVKHWRCALRLSPTPPQEAAFYEFGAGWDLIGPLVLWGLGVQQQTLVDIRPHLRMELVRSTVETYRARRAELERRHGVRLRPAPTSELRTVADLQELGIRYLAPCDARDCGLPDASVDVVTSTFTLEHIPEPDLLAILVETRRILAPEGLLTSAVDLQDHYSYTDAHVSPYGYLRWSDGMWKLFNPDLHFQNRLRYPDYVRLFRQAGFALLEQDVHVPSEQDLADVRAMRLAPRFRDVATDDLAVRWINLVGRPDR